MRRGTWGIWLLTVVVLAPVAASLLYALLYSFGITGLMAGGPTWKHWVEALTVAETWSSIGLSLGIASAVTVGAAVFGLGLALWLGERLDAGALALAVHVPLALPATVCALSVWSLFSGTGLAWRLLQHGGLLGRLDGSLSLVQDPWGLGIIVAHLMTMAPFLALTFRGLYRHERIEELRGIAASLGAGAGQQVTRVAIPILLWRASSTLALLFVVSLGSYEIPLLLGRQSPQMLSVVVMRKYTRFDLLEKPTAMVISLLYTGLVAAILGLTLSRRGGLEERGP
jgi:putative spermidine/putrescine transport system permease protein